MDYLNHILYIYAKIIIIAILLITSLSIYKPKYNPFIIMNLSSYQIKIIYIIVAIITIWVALQRKTYLPFLGECVLPSRLFNNEINNNNSDKLISLDINSDADKIIWWAADPSSNTLINDVKVAYNEYQNSGIANVKNGVAKIAFVCPQSYKVKNKVLNKHIHYREVYINMLSEIKTINVNC